MERIARSERLRKELRETTNKVQGAQFSLRDLVRKAAKGRFCAMKGYGLLKYTMRQRAPSYPKHFLSRRDPARFP